MGIRIGIGGLKIGQGSTGVNWSSYWATLISAVVNDTDATKIDLTFPSVKSLDESDFTIPGVTFTGSSWTGGVLTLETSVAIYTSPTITFVPSGGTSLVKNPRFIITVDTTKAGSANDTFILPTEGGASVYDYWVDWGDGGAESHVVANTSQTKVYAAPGTYQIKIRGTFPHIYFDGGGDRLKLASIDNWGSIVWGSMYSAFNGCSNMIGTYADFPDTSIVTNFAYMFYGCSNFNGSVSFDTSNATTMAGVFQLASTFNQPLTSFDTTNVTNFDGFVRSAITFNQPVNHFNVANVTNMRGMFMYTSFDQSISTWDTGNVTSMDGMFEGTPFNHPINHLDTSSVTTMHEMFDQCPHFNQPVNDLDVSHVTNFDKMFASAFVFNQPVNNWDTSAATSMAAMFWECSVFNQSVANFDTSSVTDMRWMFWKCFNFNQSLAAFDISSVTDMLKMFEYNTALSNANYDATLISWASQTVQPNVNFHAGIAEYSSGAATTARGVLTGGANLWVIIDGGQYGAELITNGGFANATGWTLDAEWSIGSGVASYDKTDTGILQTSCVFWSGKTYTITLDVIGVGVGNAILYIYNSSYNLNKAAVVAFNTTLSFDYVCTINSTTLIIYGMAASDDVFSIDNVSVKVKYP